MRSGAALHHGHRAGSEERARKGAQKTQELEYNHALFAILRQKRKEMADAAGIPPYVIFPDKTLIEMAAYYPQSSESLRGIFGVGHVKASQYGHMFVSVIKSFCETHGLEARPIPLRNARGKPGILSPRQACSRRTYDAHRPGIQRRRKDPGPDGAIPGNAGTIFDHLTKFAVAGNPLRNGEELESLSSATLEQRRAAFAAFDELGAIYLRPVFDKLDSSLNYEELKVLRLLYLAARGE